MAGIASLAGGETFRQALNVLLIPVLVRLYSPEEYGVFTLFTALVFLLFPLAAFRLEMAIPMVRHQRVAQTLVFLSLVCGLFFSSVVLVFSPWIALGVFGASTYQVLSCWLSREKKFYAITWTRVAQTVTQFAIQCGLGWWMGGAKGLIIGMVVGQYVGIATLARAGGIALSWARPRYWMRLLRRYYAFFIYNLPATVVSTISFEACPLLFALFYPIESVGYLGLTLRVLGLPSALIGQAVGKVFYPTYSQLKSPEEARHFVQRCLRQLIMVSAVVFTFVGLTAPKLFSVVCGPEWAQAGRFAQLLCPWFFANLVTSPLLAIAMVKDKQKQLLQFNIVGALFRLLPLILFGPMMKIETAILIYGLVGVIFDGVRLLWVLYLSDVLRKSLGSVEVENEEFIQ